MKHVVAVAVLLALCGSAWAQIKITGETKVDQYKLVRLAVEGVPENAAVLWDYDEDVLDAEPSGRRLVFAGPPGKYRIKATSIVLDKDGRTKAEVAKAVVEIGGKAPEPGPKPPDPPPGPGPGPDPKDEAPIKAPGNRVLLIYESGELSKLPPKQSNQIYSKALREWLTQKCVTDTDNPKGAWRIWDKDVDASGEAKPWQDALKRDRKSVPWLIISNGKAGYEGPLPADAESTLALLKKHLGE